MTLSLNNTHILIVGGAGFVGSNLAKLLIKTNDTLRVTVLDNLLSAEKFNIPDSPRVRFIEGSVSDDKTLAKVKDEYDFIFHLATYHGNQSSIHDPLKDHQNNTLTTLKLYETVKNFKQLKKIVYSSAGCSVAAKTFGTAVATVESEETSIIHDSPYSISKIIGEFYSSYYFRQHQVPVVRLRFQNVFGPGEVLGAGQWRGTPATVWRNVTPTFIYRALKGLPLSVENKGIATRDFIFVEDICRGLIAAARKGKAGDVYNLASGKQKSIRELADQINRITKNKAGLIFLPKRSWDNSGKRYGSTVKSKKELGFECKTEFDKGLEKTIRWTRENMALIEKTMAKHKKHMPIDR